MEGWILIYRQICDHPFYKERRVFSRLEAWFDLLIQANHKDHKFLMGSEIVEAQRGEVITSELTLMERWRWSKSKVRRYIKNLEDERMVIKKADSKKTSLFIINYDSYQKPQTAEKPQKNRGETAERPQKIHNQINIKNEKNENKKEGRVSPPSSSPSLPVNGLVEIWNQICVPVLSQVLSIHKRREATIRARMKERPDLEEWRGIFQGIMQSPFLIGENDRGWRADFDWVLKPENLTRILEGRYNDGRKNGPAPKRGMDALKEMADDLLLKIN